MAAVNDRNGMLWQNLADAGCSAELSAECIALAEFGLSAQMLQKLKKQRQGLLDEIHFTEQELRCLDYLIYKVENEQ